MAVHSIPDADAQKLTTPEGRKWVMQNYNGIYSGENTDGEAVLVTICSTALKITTSQNNGWIRINWYDASGLPAGETFDGKWR